jgi:hypothetical protein
MAGSTTAPVTADQDRNCNYFRISGRYPNPFAAVYLLSELKVLSLTTDNLLIMAVVLAVIDGIVFYLV